LIKFVGPKLVFKVLVGSVVWNHGIYTKLLLNFCQNLFLINLNLIVWKNQ